MDDFIGESIAVERAPSSPRPVRFEWRGEIHEVADVLNEWVDVGFGGLPPRSRKWYTRRHRRYYVLRDSAGAIFEVYLDYSNKSKPTWFLVRRLASYPE